MKLNMSLVMKQVERREWLCKHPPLCPNCKAEQIQLVNSYDKPATWKCRECHRAFNYEPYEHIDI